MRAELFMQKSKKNGKKNGKKKTGKPFFGCPKKKDIKTTAMGNVHLVYLSATSNSDTIAPAPLSTL